MSAIPGAPPCRSHQFKLQEGAEEPAGTTDLYKMLKEKEKYLGFLEIKEEYIKQ